MGYMLPSPDSPSERARSLIARKDALEAELEAQGAPAQGGMHEDGRATYGHSAIVDPWGKVIAKLDHDEPGFLVADLDLDQVAAARAKIPAWAGGPDFEGP